MKYQIIAEGVSCTFADYFKLNLDAEDILAHFGYSFQAKQCVLPRTSRKLERLDDLKSRLEESLPYLSLTSETARREFLIAPVLLEVAHYIYPRKNQSGIPAES